MLINFSLHLHTLQSKRFLFYAYVMQYLANTSLTYRFEISIASLCTLEMLLSGEILRDIPLFSTAVTVLDITAILSQGGVHDATTGTNYLGIFMIGDTTVTTDPSLTYYIGREVDTGPGETGHGAYLEAYIGGITTTWVDTGLSPGTWFTSFTQSTQRSLRAGIDQSSGGDERVGAYRMSVVYKGWTEQNVMMNEYRGGMVV